MDTILCDELLQEIFLKLPPSSFSSVSLVSKRWLFLFRSSRTSLSLRLLPHSSFLLSLSSLLSHHSSLSSLSLFLSSGPSAVALTDDLLAVVSSRCSHLRALRFLPFPVSLSSMVSLSKACTHLTSLCITLHRPIFLKWILAFPSLKELSISLSSVGFEKEVANDDSGVWEREYANRETELGLGLESVCLAGIRGDDWGIGWLWRSCKRLKKLQLQNCQGIGGSYSSFAQSLKNLQEIEVRTCRSIIDAILLNLSENCETLNSLLVYDGGSREGLHYFFSHTRSNLHNLDLRLPLDLDNAHLAAIAANFRNLTSLRLQNCCLVTGSGLKLVGTSMASSGGLEELSLINCDVVERESGLLASLGQNLRQLRKLDLSHNELLNDKEFISMSVSCTALVDLKLRGCRGLTGAAMASVVRNCKFLENVDIMHCCGIESEAIEVFMEKCPKLRRISVEENKLSDAAKMWASNRFIEVVV